VSPVVETLGRKFARVATDVVVRRPRLWRAFRPLLRAQFDNLAPRWDQMRSGDPLASLERALEAVDGSPAHVLDLGTGTGLGAFLVARRFPETEVVGVDLAPRMVEQARRNTPPELASRVTFQQADASQLPFQDGAFDLVTLANMIPFFDELARVTAPGGWAAFSFSAGPETPIWVPPERLREELAPRGFTDFAEFEAGPGTALLARKHDPG
jgi:ubiquinone/menaquinone biosynthesis C-methylase UbiE